MTKETEQQAAQAAHSAAGQTTGVKRAGDALESPPAQRLRQSLAPFESHQAAAATHATPQTADTLTAMPHTILDRSSSFVWSTHALDTNSSAAPSHDDAFKLSTTIRIATVAAAAAASTPTSHLQLASSLFDASDLVSLSASADSPAALAVPLESGLTSITRRQRPSHARRRVVPVFMGAVVEPAPAMQDAEALPSVIAASSNAVAPAPSSPSFTSMSSPLESPSTPIRRGSALQSAMPTPSNFGFLSPFRSSAASATSTPWARSPLQSVDLHPNSPLSPSATAASSSASRPPSRYQAERARRTMQSQAERDASQRDASLVLSGHAALPGSYLRMLQESSKASTAKASAAAQNMFASTYGTSGARALTSTWGSRSSSPPVAAASASLINPAFSSSTWSSFRFDPHAFSSATSSPAATVSVGVTTSSTSVALPSGPSLAEQMARRELSEMEQMTNATIAALMPESSVDLDETDDDLTSVQQEASRLETEMPPLPYLPTYSPRKVQVLSHMLGQPTATLSPATSSPARATTSALIVPPGASHDLFVTPVAPKKKRRLPHSANVGSTVAASPASGAAFSAPPFISRDHEDSPPPSTKVVRKRKVVSADSKPRVRSTKQPVAASVAEETESLRVKKRSMRDIIIQADWIHQRLAQNSAPSEDRTETSPLHFGMSASQQLQLRAQIQLHTQLLAQSIWLCSVLPQPTRKHSHIDHTAVGKEARALMSQLVDAAEGQSRSVSPPESVSEPMQFAQIILDLGADSSPRTPYGSSPSARKRRKLLGGRAALDGDTTDDDIPAKSDESHVCPFGETTSIEAEGNHWPVLQVPSLGLWSDERFQSLPLVPTEPATTVITEEDKENAPTSTVSPLTAGYTKKRGGRAVLSLPAATVHQYWDDLVVTHQLDERFLPKILPHERHLFTAAEEHLFQLGLQTVHWELARMATPPTLGDPNVGSVSGVMATATAAVVAGKVTLPAASSLMPDPLARLESFILGLMRRRFLPAKSLNELRERLHKLRRKEEQAKQLATNSPIATALVLGSLSPESAHFDSPSPNPIAISSPAAASPASASAFNEHAPVVHLRDFTPRELSLAVLGWSEFHASRSKWSEIANKYLPAWPRKLLAKAWLKHQERAVRDMTPHIPKKKVGRPAIGKSDANAALEFGSVDDDPAAEDEIESVAPTSVSAASASSSPALASTPASSLPPLAASAFHSPAARSQRPPVSPPSGGFDTMEDEEEDEQAAPLVVRAALVAKVLPGSAPVAAPAKPLIKTMLIAGKSSPPKEKVPAPASAATTKPADQPAAK